MHDTRLLGLLLTTIGLIALLTSCIYMFV